MPSVTARIWALLCGAFLWYCSRLRHWASEQQAKASSEQQTKNPNAPPTFNESVQPPGAQPRDGSPGKHPQSDCDRAYLQPLSHRRGVNQ
jgi:hypothetical protein